MVEAAGVEPDMSVENTQLTDSENARIGMNSRTAKSTVRSLYSRERGASGSAQAPSAGSSSVQILACVTRVSMSTR
jgi:hypothetical protein